MANNSQAESPPLHSEHFKITQVPQLVSKRDDVPNHKKSQSPTRPFSS